MLMQDELIAQVHIYTDAEQRWEPPSAVLELETARDQPVTGNPAVLPTNGMKIKGGIGVFSRAYFFLTALILICSFPIKIPYTTFRSNGAVDEENRGWTYLALVWLRWSPLPDLGRK